MTLRDRIGRRVLPRIVVALSTVRWPGRIAAALRRMFGGSADVQLYVAFDDPYSAVAVLGLVDRLAARRARLIVEPVVTRGIAGDPAVQDKRRYAITDARRLGRRAGLELSRAEPLPPDATAFLAAWAGSAPQGPELESFIAAAMRRLWFETDGPVAREDYTALWRQHLGGDPPAEDSEGELPGERGMRRCRLYDTPVAVVAGQWFFAHERLEAIEHRLDELGWKASA